MKQWFLLHWVRVLDDSMSINQRVENSAPVFPNLTDTLLAISDNATMSTKVAAHLAIWQFFV
jgi:hypothetical protein